MVMIALKMEVKDPCWFCPPHTNTHTHIHTFTFVPCLCLCSTWSGRQSQAWSRRFSSARAPRPIATLLWWNWRRRWKRGKGAASKTPPHTRTHAHWHLGETWKVLGRRSRAEFLVNISDIRDRNRLFGSVWNRWDENDHSWYLKCTKRQQKNHFYTRVLLYVDQNQSFCCLSFRSWSSSCVSVPVSKSPRIWSPNGGVKGPRSFCFYPKQRYMWEKRGLINERNEKHL